MGGKFEGIIRVDKLCAIHLMEADFNQLNRLMFGHRMMKNLKQKIVFLEAYGSRAYLTAILVTANRRLVIDN